jgi:hypothetical protein
VTLVLPAGAVTSSTLVSFVQVTDRAGLRVPDGYRLGTTRLQLAAQDVGGQPTPGFLQPATLTVRPASSELADVNDDPTNLTLAQENPDLGVWEVLETTAGDDGSPLLSATVNRPGMIAVLEATN